MVLLKISVNPLAAGLYTADATFCIMNLLHNIENVLLANCDSLSWTILFGTQSRK